MDLVQKHVRTPWLLTCRPQVSSDLPSARIQRIRYQNPITNASLRLLRNIPAHNYGSMGTRYGARGNLLICLATASMAEPSIGRLEDSQVKSSYHFSRSGVAKSPARYAKLGFGLA